MRWPKRAFWAAASRSARASAPAAGRAISALFGYDPLQYLIGRGALEATGIGFELKDGDVAIRANFCTVDANGNITDRRAGRIPTEESAPLAVRLRNVKIPGVEVFVEPVKEHRFVVVFRGPGLHGNVHDTDPQVTGVPPLDPVAADADSKKTADVAKEFIRQARELLGRRSEGQLSSRCAASPASRNCRATRKSTACGRPRSPSTRCTRAWPDWSAWTSSARPKRLAEQMTVLEQNWSKYDFFFIHFKYTDSTGEDGNFAAKVKRIEEFDAAVPRITALKPDVLIVTGDHSTPSMLEEPQLAPGADAALGKVLPHRPLREVRRKRMPPRRPGPVRGQVPDDAGPGQRPPTGQIWGVINSPQRTQSSQRALI